MQLVHTNKEVEASVAAAKAEGGPADAQSPRVLSEADRVAAEAQLPLAALSGQPAPPPPGPIEPEAPGEKDTRDVFISTKGKTLSELPKGAVIGSASLR